MQQFTLSILRARLGLGDPAPPPQTRQDWQDVLDFSVRQRVTLLLYDFFKTHPAPPPQDLLGSFKTKYFFNSVRSQRFESELIELNRLFAKENLSFIPLKGVMLSHQVYGDTGLRPSADLDILVKPRDLDAAEQLLHQRGYRWALSLHPWREKIYRWTTHHWSLSHAERSIYLELHFDLRPKNRSAPLEVENLWSHSQFLTLHNEPFRVLSDEDLFLVLAMHSASGGWDSLLHLNDLATLLQNHDPDWQLILERSTVFRCRKRCLLALAILQDLFHIALPDSIQSALSRSRGMQRAKHIAAQRLFTDYDSARPFIPQHLWFDPWIADKWQDRLTIMKYKIMIQGVKMAVNRGRPR